MAEIPEHLPGYVKVYMAMKALADKGLVSGPHERIAKVARMNPKTVSGAIQCLLDDGFIGIVSKQLGSAPTLYRIGDDDISNRPHQQVNFSDETVASIIKMFGEGVTTAGIGRAIGRTKNAVVGKIHRLQQLGILPKRPNPVPLSDERREELKMERTKAHHGTLYPDRAPIQGGMPIPVGTIALPALPSEIAEEAARPPPVFIMMPPVAVDEPEQPVTVFKPRPSTQCNFPLWGDHERPTHVYCEAIAKPGRPYCVEHAKMCYSNIRPSTNIDRILPTTGASQGRSLYLNGVRRFAI